MHLGEEVLQELADGAAGGDEPRIRRHLDGCATCAARLEAIVVEDGEVEALLRSLGHPVPLVSVEDLARRGRARRPRPRVALAAAVALLVLAGGAAAAMSSETVRGMVGRAWQSVIGRGGAAAAPAARPPAGDQTPPLGTGIAFAPGRTVEIEFLAAQDVGTLEITASPDSLVHVDPVGGTGRFSIGSAGVRIDNAGSSASYRIALPTDVLEARVRVAGRVVAEQRDGRIASVPGGRNGERLVVPLRR